MARISPTLEGFQAAFRRPAFSLAEITWRWTVGATAYTVFLFGLLEFLNTLPVSNADALFLRTRQPVLVGQAIAHIFRGSLRRGVFSLMLAGLLLGVLWIVVASIGRGITLRALFEYFAERKLWGADLQGSAYMADGFSWSAFRSLVGLNSLRAVIALAGLLGMVGALLVSRLVSKSGPGFLLFLLLAGLVWLAWVMLNWFVSLASLFAVRDRSDTLGSLSAAGSFFRDRLRAVLAVSTWCDLGHLVAFFAATTVVAFPLGLARVVPGRLVTAGVIVVTLLYFAVVDWFYVARLAGYVCIAEMPEELWVPLPPSPVAPVVPAVQSTIDRDELILSDVPGMAAP